MKTRWIRAGGNWGYPVAAVVPDVGSLLEYIHKVSGTWSVTIDVVNVISKENEKPICFYKAARYNHRLATGLC